MNPVMIHFNDIKHSAFSGVFVSLRLPVSVEEIAEQLLKQLTILYLAVLYKSHNFPHNNNRLNFQLHGQELNFFKLGTVYENSDFKSTEILSEGSFFPERLRQHNIN